MKLFKRIAGFFGVGSKQEKRVKTTKTIRPEPIQQIQYQRFKQKVYKSRRVQRVGNKTIIHEPQTRGGLTSKQMQRGHNKILSLHAMFVQRAGLTKTLQK